MRRSPFSEQPQLRLGLRCLLFLLASHGTNLVLPDPHLEQRGKHRRFEAPFWLSLCKPIRVLDIGVYRYSVRHVGILFRERHKATALQNGILERRFFNQNQM